MTTNTTTAYAARSRKLHALLDELRGQLARHAVEAGRMPKSWGFVGDLGHVDGLLSEAVSFLARASGASRPEGAR